MGNVWHASDIHDGETKKKKSSSLKSLKLRQNIAATLEKKQNIMLSIVF